MHDNLHDSTLVYRATDKDSIDERRICERRTALALADVLLEMTNSKIRADPAGQDLRRQPETKHFHANLRTLLL